MKSILITGGAGYIGSHTVRELLNRNYKVVVVDNLCNGHREALSYKNEQVVNPLIEFYQIDVRDRKSMRLVFEKHNISAVIHLAALAIVEESFKREKDYFDNNVNGTQVVLELCLEFNVKNFVFSSSSTIYGNVNGAEKLTEKHRTEPINPYGQSKLLCEQKIKEFAPGVHAICLRYFNVAGASTDLSNGPRGRGSGRVFFNLTEALLSGQEFMVNGTDYMTTDGTCVRDYIHVEDIADIHVHALEYLLEVSAEVSFVLNCGYGRGYSIKEIIEAYKRFNNVDVRVHWGPRRQGDPAYLVGDNSELVRVLGWKSRFDDPLQVICQSVYKWGLRRKKVVVLK